MAVHIFFAIILGQDRRPIVDALANQAACRVAAYEHSSGFVTKLNAWLRLLTFLIYEHADRQQGRGDRKAEAHKAAQVSRVHGDIQHAPVVP
ncbi:hypothetical protein CENSYa_1072 [Cenarchaeum symbiosum A]|uniref:Uncharacterized protein n=1 Tax=Cenarchaeum symbiosum (strain A) TaxID=414004 RepID=A0RWI5_CENSY|nr:hypothetical protein CENSYa_1072 [Cenarchaeum symbiosum A]